VNIGCDDVFRHIEDLGADAANAASEGKTSEGMAPGGLIYRRTMHKRMSNGTEPTAHSKRASRGATQSAQSLLLEHMSQKTR